MLKGRVEYKGQIGLVFFKPFKFCIGDKNYITLIYCSLYLWSFEFIYFCIEIQGYNSNFIVLIGKL